VRLTVVRMGERAHDAAQFGKPLEPPDGRVARLGPQMPPAAKRSNTSPGPGSGVSIVSTRRSRSA
jgi:hypothetical protein